MFASSPSHGRGHWSSASVATGTELNSEHVSVVTCRRLSALNHADDALQGCEEIFTRSCQLHIFYLSFFKKSDCCC
jgi:hypothetical protein